MKKYIALLSFILGALLPSVSNALTPDSWDDPNATSPWSIISPNGQRNQIQCENSSLYACSGICPSQGANQGRITCNLCTQGTEAVTVRYTDPSPSSPAGVTYIVLDVYSCGQDRMIGIQVRDSGSGVYPPNPSSSACRNGSTTVAGVTIGRVAQNQWDTIYLSIPNGVSLSNIATVDFILFDGEIQDNEVVYFDNLRTMNTDPCALHTPTSTPTATSNCGGFTCTPTPTLTVCVDINNGYTCTPIVSPIPTFTPTPTFTTTSTPWPMMVFPNPMDFEKSPPDANYCASFQPPIRSAKGCVKFIGLPRGSTVEIYTVALAKVRSFAPADINFPVPAGLGMRPNPDVGWIAWNGDNEDLNPVSAGIYFYVVKPPEGDKFIGKLAISRARKVN